ncbi:MAG: hypothetical protein U0992_21780 [Planctomycetaceae bacterium]
MLSQDAKPQAALSKKSRVLFLHHSTGECIWNGGVPAWFDAYNVSQQTHYDIEERAFPKESPYGWENFPYDYWNIWVRHAGTRAYREEPTLEMLTKQYQVIVFKHCFPVSNIEADTGTADVSSAEKRIENYKLQYAALKAKLKSFPGVRFVVWTGAAQVASDVDEGAARRAREFFEWVVTKWDEPADNIFVFDFYALETEGGHYIRPEYASGDAHPNEEFSQRVAPLFAQRVVDVIEGRGDTGSMTGGDIPVAVVDRTQPPAIPKSAATRSAAPATAPAGEQDWVLENGENPARLAALWDKSAVQYVADGKQHVVKIDFTTAESQDWGEYGPHRVVFTRAPQSSTDVSAYRYLALRVRTKESVSVVLSLRTLPKPQENRYQPHFAYSAYFDTTAGAWKWIVLDLGRLELALEGGEDAYVAAGRPERIQQLTTLGLAVHDKYAGDEFLVDDVTFYKALPADLKPYLVAE